jgi:RND family efflux transporter MFP subunit
MFDSRITPDPNARASAPKGRPRGWIALGLILALLAGGGLWVARSRAPAPTAPPAAAVAPTPVLTVALAGAANRAVATAVTADGSVVAWQELVIGAEIGGLRLLEVPVEEGQAVRVGDLLARLDDGVLAAQAAQAEAAILEAMAARDLATADLARAESLVRTQSASVQVAEQRRSAALQAEARLASARARRDEAAARLAQARILAPADGVLARVTARIGTVTAMGQEMFRLVRDGRLELDARVPELDLAAIRPGQPVTVRHGGRTVMAEVRAIAPLVAPESRLGIVHVALPAESGLRPGMFAAAEIAGPRREVVMIPAAAVVFRDGAPHAFVLPEGSDRVRLRRLAAGERRDGLVEIREGMQAGERVVITGAGFLADGDLVRVAP